MKSTALLVVQARAGGGVERCHTIPHLGDYTNAQHQWGAALLLYYVFPEYFSGLVLYVLTHDVTEFWVGDIPAPTLRYIPGVRASVRQAEQKLSGALGLPSEHDLSAEQHSVLKACDRLDFWLWCREQLRRGNDCVVEPLREIQRYLHEDTCRRWPLVRTFMDSFRELEREGLATAAQASMVRDVIGGEG